ncbi:hypothetical protein M0813_02266 [Anaeramoeba flamelloides]|uniref:Uncharacterized protein n=1 Tax=Anaeramoeba flamelloides TaxID=1746091 RepID=A0ABQ8YQY0_9EUKA|nr:hypothetical protein M0813_02266 [Anaeramoeba flamelloides]
MNKTNYQIIFPKNKSNQKGHKITKCTYHKKIKKNLKSECLRDQTKQNLKKIGIFHYDSIKLIELSSLFTEEELFETEFQFYVPFKIISFENENVVNRTIWATNDRTYSPSSDLVPVIIHSSQYIPDKTKLQSTPVGVIVGVTHLDSQPQMYNMRRKNGIRSRYSTKQTGFVVTICSIQFLYKQSEIPTDFLEKNSVSKQRESNNNKSQPINTHNTTNNNHSKNTSDKNANHTTNCEYNCEKPVDDEFKNLLDIVNTPINKQDDQKISNSILSNDMKKKSFVTEDQTKFKVISVDNFCGIENNPFSNFNPLESQMQSNYDFNFGFDFDLNLNFEYDFENYYNYESQCHQIENINFDALFLDTFSTTSENKSGRGKRLSNDLYTPKFYKRFIRD